MSDGRAYFGIIGKGDDPGVKVRVEYYPPGAGDAARQAHLAPVAQGPGVEARISEKWAVVSSDFHPPPDPEGYTAKVSRHLDAHGRPWTWIGLYQVAPFRGETRTGHYFGVGLALEQVTSIPMAMAAIHDLLAAVRGSLFTDGVMARSIFDLDFSKFRARPVAAGFEPVEVCLDATAPRARLVIIDTGSFLQELPRVLQQALQGAEARSLSTIYIGNWSNPSGRTSFYVQPDVAPVTPPPPPVPPLSVRTDPASGGATSAFPSFGGQEMGEFPATFQHRNAGHSSTPSEAGVAEILSNLGALDRSLRDLNKKMDGVAHSLARLAQPELGSRSGGYATRIVTCVVGIVLLTMVIFALLLAIDTWIPF